MKSALIYVIGAYSGDVKKNIEEAEAVSIGLIRQGFGVITPHKNTAGYEKYEGNGITYDTWIRMDMDILSRCDAVYVMKNSINSNGVKKEIEHARSLKLPIIYEKHCPISTIEPCPVCGFPLIDWSDEIEYDFRCVKCEYREQEKYGT